MYVVCAVLYNRSTLSIGLFKERIEKPLTQSIMLYGAEGRTLNTQQANKPLTNEMYIWKKKIHKKSRENCLEMTQLEQI
jgi:hypothetical protein